MAGYIYTVKEVDNAQPDYPGMTRIQTTRKYEARKFLEARLSEGLSPAQYEVSRSRDGIRDTMVYVDVYEFMNIDLGEIL
jgi:hypothetical protein